MELTPEDVKRISEAGFSGFHIDLDDAMTLRNVDGRCFFLDPSGRCGIYDIRPEGCGLYPLVMDISSMTPCLDDGCPHTEEFSIDPDDVMQLANLIECLGGA